MKFNINNYVKVRITPNGIKALETNHNHLKNIAPSIGDFRPPEIDSDGFVKFQLWQLMQEFGPYIKMGVALPFETEIEIEAIPYAD